MTVVVVGSSVAGVRTAQDLRGQGYDGHVVLVGRERHLPYDRPPLSKQVLGGDGAAAEAFLLDADAARDLDVELRLGVPATSLDPGARTLDLGDGTTLDYDDLVVATGSYARPSPWTPRRGLRLLRDLDDARTLRADLVAGGPVVVVGAGFIGSEVASAAARMGVPVSLVDPAPMPMAAVVGDAVGVGLADLHRRHGVRTHFGVGVEDVEDVEDGGLRVILTDGTVLDAAVVVVGIGAAPADAWLEGSGLVLDDGVVCDASGRADGADHVYAAGDVARWRDPDDGDGRRVEHWTNAVEQAAVVAHAITHPDAPQAHRSRGYVWSDQHDWKVQIVGETGRSRPHLVGDLDGDRPRAAALFESDGRLCGAVTVNWPKAMLGCRRLLDRDADMAEAVAALAPVPDGAASR